MVEAMIAITIIFGSLTALAYTATTGFKYVAYAREKQAANGIANQVMEEIRGLVYSNIQQGLTSGPVAGPNPLASDPNAVTGCPADNVGARCPHCDWDATLEHVDRTAHRSPACRLCQR